MVEIVDYIFYLQMFTLTFIMKVNLHLLIVTLLMT